MARSRCAAIAFRRLTTPPVPAAPATLPTANALLTMPLLKPTSPPAVPLLPTKTSPIANENAMVPSGLPPVPRTPS